VAQENSVHWLKRALVPYASMGSTPQVLGRRFALLVKREKFQIIRAQLNVISVVLAMPLLAVSASAQGAQRCGMLLVKEVRRVPNVLLARFHFTALRNVSAAQRAGRHLTRSKSKL